MARIVQKFGGTSVADIDRIRKVAARVQREIDAGNEVAVVVSAMAGVTNQLVGWVREATGLSELDAYQFVSQFAKAPIVQLVDPEYTVLVKLEKKRLPHGR